MRYVLVSDVECRGGAGIAAGRLAAALAARGHDVHWVAARPDGQTHAWHSVSVHLGGPARVLDVLCRQGAGELRSRLRGMLVRRALRAVLDELAPDVVNLHNVHGARWPAGVLDAVPTGALPVWTLHDMWTLTGRCAYAYDCRQYLAGCTATCPTPDEYPALAPGCIAAAFATRRDVLRRRPDAIAVAPSRWLAREARAGLWHRHRVVHIPNAVPSDAYFPVLPAAAREALGLDAHEPVIVVVAERLSERRKGWALLRNALEHLRVPSLRVVLVGDGGPDTSVPGPHRATVLGRVDQVERQRLVLSAADMLVHPAPVDNLPNVVLEAMACGLPTVAFGVGGLPDMVRPGLTGWLAGAPSAEALAETLRSALASDPGRAHLRARCRELAVSEYAPDLQARRYEALVTGRDDDQWPETRVD